MLFTITEIQTENDIIYVSGSTLAGNLKGVWKYSDFPIKDTSYNIELNFSTIDRKSVTISKPPVSIEITGDKVTFTALYEGIDEIYYLRFSSDGLSMLDISADDFTIRKGDYISFSKHFREIEIYPY